MILFYNNIKIKLIYFYNLTTNNSDKRNPEKTKNKKQITNG